MAKNKVYKVVNHLVSHGPLEDTLNHLSRAGWEVVSVLHSTGNGNGNYKIVIRQ